MENDNLILSEDGKTLIGVKDKSITHVVIPEGVTTIGYKAFKNCKFLQSIDIPFGVMSIKNYAFLSCESLQSIDIPNSVKTIGDSAFAGCISLQSIDIPDSVTTIRTYAFMCCESLRNLDIPDSVTTIGACAFYGCKSLQSIEISKNNSNYASIDGILYSKYKNVIIKIPPGKELVEYKIPYNVTTIDAYAFEDCESLRILDIPNNIMMIKRFAFLSCKSLQSIYIPDSVTEIGDSLFQNCESLQAIHMHHKSIEDCVIDEEAFTDVNFDQCILYIPSGTLWAYRHHPAFAKFKYIVMKGEE